MTTAPHSPIAAPPIASSSNCPMCGGATIEMRGSRRCQRCGSITCESCEGIGEYEEAENEAG